MQPKIQITRPRFGLVTGPSGVGKHYGFGSVFSNYSATKIFVTGDWCRVQAVEHAQGGFLVNDELIQTAAMHAYENYKAEYYDAPFCFLVDAPRTLEQAQYFCEQFVQMGARDLKDILTFHISAEPKICRDRIISRAIAQQRLDDQDPATVRRRLGVYYGQEVPGGTDLNYTYTGVGGVQNTVIPWLEQHTTVHHIDADIELEDVRNTVRLCLLPEVFKH